MQSQLTAARILGEDGEPHTLAYLEATFAEYKIAAETASAVPLEHMRVAVVDDADSQIDEHFNSAIQFIDAALDAGGKVIVHCKHGQSRSATMLAAWFVARKGMSVDQAISHLKRCRPRVRPNQGFVQQLHQYAQTLHPGK